MHLHITLQSILKVSHHAWLDTAGEALGTSFVAYYIYCLILVIRFETFKIGAGPGSVFSRLTAFEQYRKKWFSFLLPVRWKTKKLLALYAEELIHYMLKFKTFSILSESEYGEMVAYFEKIKKDDEYNLHSFFREELQKNLDLLMRQSEFVSMKGHLERNKAKLLKISPKSNEFADNQHVVWHKNQFLSLKFICGLLSRSCPQEFKELQYLAQHTYDRWRVAVIIKHDRTEYLRHRFEIVH